MKTSSNAHIFNLCPPLLASTLLTIAIVQFSPSTNPAVLPVDFSGDLAPLLKVLFLIAAFAGAFIWATKPKTLWNWVCVLSAAFVLPISTLMLRYSLSQTLVGAEATFDLNVIPVDGSLGFQPSMEMGKIFLHFPYFAQFSTFFYDQIIAVMAVAAAGEAYYGRRLGVGSIPTFLLMSSVGFVIYFFLPVVGPAPFFGDTFPVPTGMLASAAPRNCMPSLHTAYAIMAFLATRNMNGYFRAAVGCMSAMVIVATLGLGQHYLVDVILAFPLVLLFRSLSAFKAPFQSFERISAFAISIALLLVWGSVVRGLLNPPHTFGFTAAAMIITVGVSLSFERRVLSVETRKTARRMAEIAPASHAEIMADLTPAMAGEAFLSDDPMMAAE